MSRTEHAAGFELVDQPGSARIAQAHLPLQVRRAGAPAAPHQVDRLVDEGFVAVFRLIILNDLFPGSFFLNRRSCFRRLRGRLGGFQRRQFKLLLTAWVGMFRPPLDHGADLSIGDHHALRALQTCLGMHEEHVALAEQRFRTGLVENDPRIDLRCHGESDARREVRLDYARDHVHTRALGRDNEVNTDGAGFLRQPDDLVLGLFSGVEHQIRQFIDHNDDARQLRFACLYRSGIVRIQVPRADLLQKAVAVIHFGRSPAQNAHDAFDFGLNLAVEVRQPAEALQLHAFRIDHDQFEVIRVIVQHKRHGDRRDADGLARVGRAGDQQVGHGGEVRNDRLARNASAKRDRQRRIDSTELLRLQQRAQAHEHVFGIGHFHAHVRLTWDGRDNAQAFRLQRQRQVFGEGGDFGNADFLFVVLSGFFDVPGFHRELGHGGSHPVADHLRGHTKLGQGFLKQAGVHVDGRLVRGNHLFVFEQGQRRQAIRSMILNGLEDILLFDLLVLLPVLQREFRLP